MLEQLIMVFLQVSAVRLCTHRNEARLHWSRGEVRVGRDRLQEFDVRAWSNDLVLSQSPAQYRECFGSIFAVHNKL